MILAIYKAKIQLKRQYGFVIIKDHKLPLNVI